MMKRHRLLCPESVMSIRQNERSNIRLQAFWWRSSSIQRVELSVRTASTVWKLLQVMQYSDEGHLVSYREIDSIETCRLGRCSLI